MSYHLRTKSGELKVGLDNNTAREFMAGVPGFFRPTQYKNKPQKTVFEVSSDMAYILRYGNRFENSEISICLWVGDTLEPAD